MSIGFALVARMQSLFYLHKTHYLRYFHVQNHRSPSHSPPTCLIQGSPHEIEESKIKVILCKDKLVRRCICGQLLDGPAAVLQHLTKHAPSTVSLSVFANNHAAQVVYVSLPLTNFTNANGDFVRPITVG